MTAPTPEQVDRPRCDSCRDTGLVDWAPFQHRDSEDDQQPCPDGCAVPPNMVEVDENGCSCKMSPYAGFQRTPIDPACPNHGEPLQHGDGDVLVFHPDGRTTVIREPSDYPPTDPAAQAALAASLPAEVMLAALVERGNDAELARRLEWATGLNGTTLLLAIRSEGLDVVRVKPHQATP